MSRYFRLFESHLPDVLLKQLYLFRRQLSQNAEAVQKCFRGRFSDFETDWAHRSFESARSELNCYRPISAVCDKKKKLIE